MPVTFMRQRIPTVNLLFDFLTFCLKTKVENNKVHFKSQAHANIQQIFNKCYNRVGVRMRRKGLSCIVCGQHLHSLSSQFLVCNHVTRRPCWWSIQKKFLRKICIKTEFISQRRETLLFLTTNMAAVTSLANQQ